MNINKVKKIIIIFLIIMLILGVTILMMIIKNENGKQEDNTINKSKLEEESDRIISEEGKIENVNSFKLFYNINNCANTYINNVKSNNNEIIYKLLSSDYIAKYNLTKENVISNLSKIDKNEILYVKKMYQRALGDDTKQYIYIDGILRKTINGVLYERSIFLTVTINLDTQTFSITPNKENFPVELQNLENVNRSFKILNVQQENKTEQNVVQTEDADDTNIIERAGGKADGYSDEKWSDIDNVNTYKEQDASDDYIARAYLTDYVMNLKYYGKNLYSELNEEYRNKRFGSVSKFEEYIGDISSYLNNISLKSYEVSYYDNYTEYTCIDLYGNYYIFDATSAMDYTIKLDYYTILSDKYKENYLKLSDQEKVAANAQRVIAMINSKDYTQIYNVLDDTFKQNNFGNVDTLKKYINQSMFNSKISYSDSQVEETGSYYVYTCTIKENNSNASISKTFTIIMKLKEGTDFVMSFNVK